MNNILHIAKKIDYKIIENYLNQINTQEITTLSIVKNLSSFKFATYPIVLQTIATLFFKHPKTKVLVKFLNERDINNLSKELIYLASIMRANLLVDEKEEEFQKKYIEEGKHFLENMKDINKISNTFKGIGVQLVCFDWSKNYAFLNTLYNGNKLISKHEFVSFLAPKLFENSMSKATIWEKTKQDLESDFANIIYELFENTELHAKDTSLAKKSIRGLRIKYTKIHENENKEKYEDIKEYLSKFTNHEFMEISIFDSGDGLAKSISNNLEFDFTIEMELVLKCFNMHTSRTGLTTRGLGLFEVMKMIKKHKGLFVLRTGRTLLKADYSIIDFKGTDLSLDPSCITKSQDIIGTSYTIILPLIQQGNQNV